MLSRFVSLGSLAVTVTICGWMGACATSASGPNGTGGNGSNGTTGSNGSFTVTTTNTDMFGSNVTSTNTGSSGSSRAQRCDDAGNCKCFNIASLGYGGQTGAQAGHGGTDNTQAFVSYLNTQSSAQVAHLGCGTDLGCTNPTKPTIDANFLAQYDVLIMQWMTNGIQPVTISGQSYGFTSMGGYWNFSQTELDAIKTWVNGGGGLIFLSGYEFCPNAQYPGMCPSGNGELDPENQILKYISGMSYNATDTFGAVETGNGFLCLGDSNVVTTWAQAPNILGEHISQVGAFHGRGISTGSNSMVDCTNSTFGVCAAHEDIGKGHVYVYTDEWVTYTSLWNPNPQPANYCVEDAGLINPAGCNGPCTAAETYYQTPQFWYNAIYYAAQATMCPFTLNGTIPR